MNILLWILQILLALHTLMGALWKFSNPETSASLKPLPHGIWQSLIVVELLCVLGLLIPSLFKRLGILAPIAAVVIAAEMILFCSIQIFSGATDPGHIIYWFIVALIAAFIAYGRFVLKPL